MLENAPPWAHSMQMVPIRVFRRDWLTPPSDFDSKAHRADRRWDPRPNNNYPVSSVLRTSPPPRSARPVPHGRLVDRVIADLTTLWGFPCCVRLPCVRAAATTPVQQLGVVFARLTQPYQPSTNPLSARPAHRPFRGLLSVHWRCGPHTRTVTYVTAIRGLQTFRRLHTCPGCFGLERSAGWVLHPLESAAFHGTRG